jgi:hypothetical protein
MVKKAFVALVIPLIILIGNPGISEASISRHIFNHAFNTQPALVRVAANSDLAFSRAPVTREVPTAFRTTAVKI